VTERSRALACSRSFAGLRVRFPLWTWMLVCCVVVCCVASGQCDGPIVRSGECYCVCERERERERPKTPKRSGLGPVWAVASQTVYFDSFWKLTLARARYLLKVPVRLAVDKYLPVPKDQKSCGSRHGQVAIFIEKNDTCPCRESNHCWPVSQPANQSAKSERSHCTAWHVRTLNYAVSSHCTVCYFPALP